MIKDTEVLKLSEELWAQWAKENPTGNASMFQYTLYGRVETNLCVLANSLERTERELAVQKVVAESWREEYLKLVKENELRRIKESTVYAAD
jgi:hypothetical protein